MKTASMFSRVIAFLIDGLLLGGFIGAFLFISMGKNTESMESSGDDAPPSIVDQWNFLSEYVPIYEYPDLFLKAGTTSIVTNYPVQTAMGWLLLPWLWFAFMESFKGGSLGKLIMGIQVRRKDFGKAGLGTTTLRFFGKLLSTLIFVLGFLLAFFDRKSQALHDKIANTMVVRR
jgi:uncharacterized RDD family membrane protein YckC